MKTDNICKLQTLCLFDNNHIEKYYRDGSVLAWKQQHIVYLSPQGIKNNFSINSIKQNAQLKELLNQILQEINTYSLSDNKYLIFQLQNHLHNTITNNSTAYETKSMKVNHFDWKNPQIQQTQKGYKIVSDDRFANVTLLHNLFMVQVEYYQLLGMVTANNNVNFTKQLLNKYNYEYTQIPSTSNHSLPQYKYKIVKNTYSIFNIPLTWQYPLSLIWTSLLEYKIIKHPFCYLDFKCEGNHKKHRSMMPQVFDIGRSGIMQNTNTNTNNMNIPIMGKQNHEDRCMLIRIQGNVDRKQHQCMIWLGGQMSMMYDGVGFWFMQGSSWVYKRMNKPEYDYKTHINTVPLYVRLQNQLQRNNKQQLQLFNLYQQQNKKRSQQLNSNLSLLNHNTKFDNESNLIKEETLQNVGTFKAYSNGCVIAKFIDKSIVNLNSKKMQIKIIDNKNTTVHISLHNEHNHHYLKYKQYILWVLDFQERVYFPQEWQSKKQLSTQLNYMVNANEALIKTIDLYK